MRELNLGLETKGNGKDATLVGQTASGILEEERKLRQPKVSMHIFFSPHQESEPVEELKKLFNEADIYIPEQMGWGPRDLMVYMLIADGSMGTDQIKDISSDNPFLAERLLMVRGSKKPIVFIDIPSERVLYKKYRKLQSKIIDIFDIFKKDEFNETVNLLIELTKSLGHLHVERERYMLANLRPTIEKVLEEDPDLRKKDEIKVLLSLGAAHTGISRNVRDKAGHFSRSFSSSPMVFSFIQEGVRRSMFGKNIEQELAANIYLSAEFLIAYNDEINNLARNSVERNMFVREIISRFSFEEAREVFEAVKGGGNLRVVFENKLKEKGIKFPQSGGQLEWFLKAGGKNAE